MLRPETVRRLTAMGMFLLPIVVVKISAMLLGESAQQSVAALAAQPSPADAIVPAATVKWTPQQLTAARHIDWLKQQPFTHSPLLYDDDQGLVPQPVHTDAPDASDTGQRRLVLQAVMASERGRTAVINGRPYREGDTVHEINAVVESIDCAARSATLRSRRNNQPITINVERPR